MVFDEQREKSKIHVPDAFAVGNFVDQGADEDIRPLPPGEHA
ncbi:hypothetical protein [Planctopirus limnophila]|nr:hypothetical protein [Planctopirus limnophila]